MPPFLDHPWTWTILPTPSTPVIPVTPSEKEHHDDISSRALPLEMILSPIVPVESPLLQPFKCKVYDSPPSVPKTINNTDRCDVAVAIPSGRAEREHDMIEGAQPLENLPTDTNVEVDQINRPEIEVSTVLEYPDNDAPSKPCVSLLRQSFSCGFCEAESTVPIAAMCGHVLCQSCVLRQLSNKASLRCPACNVTILLKLDMTDHKAISNGELLSHIDSHI
ncbi:unnamed protein product [Somion occarium]|uniref:RING-type domain-containing protein n=1 Tax=Somion occarium TaxID=3059160 RepID=A0ABP1DM18_9APHY